MLLIILILYVLLSTRTTHRRNHEWNNSSDQTITFNTEIFVGSNVTNSSGVITIGDAGVYLCHSRLCNYNVGVQDIDCNFKINSTEKPATRSYQDFLSGTDGFSATESTVLLFLSAGDTVELYGNGDIYGEIGSGTLSWWTGVRLGAKS